MLRPMRRALGAESLPFAPPRDAARRDSARRADARACAMHLARLASLVLLDATAAPGLAQGGVECRPDGNQAQMTTCALKDYKAADLRLSQQYRKTMSALDMDRQDVLRQQQRDWVSRRDLRCRDEAKDSVGGSIRALEYYTCLADLTNERTRQLRSWPSGK